MVLQKRFRLLSVFMTQCRWNTTSYLSPKLHKISKDPSNISVVEYKTRRQNLFKLCMEGEARRNSGNLLLCIPAASPAYYSDQILYPFRQNTEFNYLCGYQKPDSVLFMFSDPGNEKELFKSILFVPQILEHQKIWDGEFEGLDNIAESTGVSEVRFTKDVTSFLSTYIKDNDKFSLWYNYQRVTNPGFHSRVMADFLRQGKYKKLENCDLLIQSLRVVKSQAEIDLMKKSMEITEAAFEAVDDMIVEWEAGSARNSLFEYEIQAVMEYVCQLNGGRLAYIPVIAGGNRGNTIHYVQNKHKINPKELLLIDAGCEYKGYTTDITRVLNISGLTYEQEFVIGIVQFVQEACINMCTPENSLNDIYHQMMTVIGECVQIMGLLDLTLEGKQFYSGANRYCPHHVGHYLGMDLHDTPLVSKDKKLEPGTVLTIEPGLYLRSEYVPENLSLFKGIAVRLEENILVTQGKPVNLSKNVSPRKKTPLAHDTDFCKINPTAEEFIGNALSEFMPFKKNI